MHYIGISRVSTRKQEITGYSLDVQIAMIEARGHLIGADKLYIETGTESTKEPIEYRPKVQKVLGDMRKGKADFLIVSMSNRLVRNTAEALALVQKSQDEGWGLIFCDYEYDACTADGRFMLTIMFAKDQCDRERTSENTRRSLQWKKAHGEILGPPIVTSPSAQSYILEQISAGVSARNVAKGLDAMGEPTPTQVRWDRNPDPEKGPRPTAPWSHCTVVNTYKRLLYNDIPYGSTVMQQ